MKIHPTRFAPIGYAKICPGYWSVIALDDNAQVGPQYRTKGELLADLPRYARDSWGLEA